MKRHTLGLILALALGGCAASGTDPSAADQTAQKTLIGACDAYSKALDSATGFLVAGKLNAAQIKIVDDVRPAALKLCTDPMPGDNAAAISAVEGFTLQLGNAIAGAK